MTVKERLMVFAKNQKKSVRAFEIECGLTIGYVNAIRVSIQPDKVQSIASRYPELNIGWLLTGEGSMLKEAVEPQAAQDTITIPLKVWEVIEKQAGSLEAKDRQLDEVISMLREQLKKERPVEQPKRAAK